VLTYLARAANPESQPSSQPIGASL